ncbi:Uncharacterised protein [uncultured archaeon]|nr:Uncharacterised protein [uncultured archaeon]
MLFPQFLSSFIIACSAFAGLLFAVLTYVEKEYHSKRLTYSIIISILFITLTNLLIVISFYQSEPSMGSIFLYPLFTYFIGMIVFMYGGIYLIYGKYAKTINKS